jgi:hypothetical protein
LRQNGIPETGGNGRERAVNQWIKCYCLRGGINSGVPWHNRGNIIKQQSIIYLKIVIQEKEMNKV